MTQASNRGPSALVIGVPGPSGAWPSNEAKIGHTVDLRRPWIPSPGIRAAAAMHIDLDVDNGEERRPARANANAAEAREGALEEEEEEEEEAERRRERELEGWRARRQAPPPSSRTVSSRSSQPGSRKHRMQQRRRQEQEDAQTAGDERERPARPVNHARERPRSWLSCLHPGKLLKRSRSTLAAARAAEDDGIIPATPAGPHERPSRRELTPAEWRAYGYWARPTLGPPWTMTVHNASGYLSLLPPTPDVSES